MSAEIMRIIKASADGLSRTEIARHCGISIKAAESRLARMRPAVQAVWTAPHMAHWIDAERAPELRARLKEQFTRRAAERKRSEARDRHDKAKMTSMRLQRRRVASVWDLAA